MMFFNVCTGCPWTEVGLQDNLKLGQPAQGSRQQLAEQRSTSEAGCWGAVGVLQDWRHTLEAVSLIILVTVALYLAGGCIEGKDYRPADGEEELEPTPMKVTLPHVDSHMQ